MLNQVSRTFAFLFYHRFSCCSLFSNVCFLLHFLGIASFSSFLVRTTRTLCSTHFYYVLFGIRESFTDCQSAIYYHNGRALCKQHVIRAARIHVYTFEEMFVLRFDFWLFCLTLAHALEQRHFYIPWLNKTNLIYCVCINKWMRKTGIFIFILPKQLFIVLQIIPRIQWIFNFEKKFVVKCSKSTF